MKKIVLITKDETFFNSIEFYLKRNGSVTSWLYITKNIFDSKLMHADALLLDQDIELEEVKIQCLKLEHTRSNDYTTIFKYQKFSDLLQELQLKVGNNLEILNKNCNIIAITSVVGGAGKSLFDDYANKNLNTYKKTVSLKLVGELKHPKGLSLADLCFDELHDSSNPQMRQYEFVTNDGLLMLPGYILATDFHDMDCECTIRQLKKYASRSGICNLLIELPTIHFMQTQKIISYSDYSICILDEQRKENCQEQRKQLINNYQSMLFISNKSLLSQTFSLPFIKSDNHLDELVAVNNSQFAKKTDEIITKLGLAYA